MITLRLLNSSGLEDFINSKEFCELKNIPITRHRAISHINNPQAGKDDILLILAMKNDQIAGYLGILPDELHFASGKSDKCGWFSCLWVDNASRGEGIAQSMINKALEVWDHKILVADYTPPSKKLYDKSNAFNHPLIMEGLRLYIRMDLFQLLPPKNKLFKLVKPFWKCWDVLTNSLLDQRFLFSKNELDETRLEYVSKIADEINEFIIKKQDNQPFKRRMKEFNWILKYPWILSDPLANIKGQKYHFTSSEKDFGFYGLSLRNPGQEMVAFLLFVKRNHALKLQYGYFEQVALNEVIDVIKFLILKYKICTFTTFHPVLINYFNEHKTIALYKKKIKRSYLVSSAFNPDFPTSGIEIQAGDGDCVFV